MPNILQLISSSGFFGADNVMIQLSEELRGTGYSPIVGAFRNLHNPHTEVVDQARRRGFEVVVFPCGGRVDVKTILAIREFMKNRQIDIVHSHGYKSNLYALAASWRKNIGRVATCHNWLGDDLKMKSYALLDQFFLNHFQKVVAVSSTVKQEILQRGVNSEKVTVIHNGIDINRFAPGLNPNGLKAELQIGADFKIVGTVGRLSEEKGHSQFLRAAARVLREYPKAVFLIVGDGPLRKRLEAECSCLARTNAGGSKSPVGPGSFIFAGVRDDMPAIYSLIDILVIPSLTEGLPMVLLEAMASRKPIVATSVGAIPDVIEHGFSGLVVNPGDADGLAEAIVQLLTRPEKAGRMGEIAHRKVLQDYSSKAMSERYRQVYKDVLASNSR